MQQTNASTNLINLPLILIKLLLIFLKTPAEKPANHLLGRFAIHRAAMRNELVLLLCIRSPSSAAHEISRIAKLRSVVISLGLHELRRLRKHHASMLACRCGRNAVRMEIGFQRSSGSGFPIGQLLAIRLWLLALFGSCERSG